MSSETLRRGLAVTVMAAALTTATALWTPQSQVNEGLGFDGLQYAQMVRDLRYGEDGPVPSLAAYRLLVPALVAASGLDITDGFYVVALVASVGALILLAVLLSREAVPDRLVPPRGAPRSRAWTWRRLPPRPRRSMSEQARWHSAGHDFAPRPAMRVSGAGRGADRDASLATGSARIACVGGRSWSERCSRD